MVNPELILNAIEQIKTLCLDLMDDLDFYRSRPNPHPGAIDIRQKRIDTLFTVCEAFTTVYNQIETERENVNKTVYELNTKIFKAEACAYYYGVSPTEIWFFTNHSPEGVAEKLNRCIAEKWRQVPLAWHDVIDPAKAQQRQNKIQITINKEGEVEYRVPDPPEIKTATAPVYDLNASLSLLKNSQNQPGINGKKN